MSSHRRAPRLLAAAGALAALAVLAGAAPPAAAQSPIPEKFTNLEVLPDDISRQDLVRVMRGFTAALGARCETCHATKPGADPQSGELEDLDFASDAKDPKKTARRMMRMVHDINANYLDHSPVEVQCFTCHRGVARPEPIEAIVAGKLVDGPAAAAEAYRELRRRYYGASSYDFTERPLARLGQSLLERGEAANALAVLRLNAEQFPDSAALHHLIGEALLQTGDRDGARAAFTRSLELDSDNPRARQRLAELAPVTPP